MKVHNILVIDDEQEVCILLQNFLVKKDNLASYSTTLKDGIAKFEELNPDLLILDHNLPDGYGIDSISHFKKLNNSIRIIIISALSNLKNEALSKGADHFLEKPISFSTLNTILENIN